MIANQVFNEIELRKVIQDDCDKIYQWRNHPEVRRNSINKNEIEYNDHAEWFSQALSNNNMFLLIGYLKSGEEIGTLRFDLNNNIAEVSIYLSPAFIGKGLGKLMLASSEKWLKNNAPNIKWLEAKILTENIRSKNVFLSAGYVPILETYRKGISNE